jgi:hypothetical protein
MVRQRGTYRITPKMLVAGADAMRLCHDEGGHTPETVAIAVFHAMIGAADVTIGRDIRKTFAWSPHDDPRRDRTLQILPANPRTRADFDADGMCRTEQPDGTVHVTHISNFWYLLRDWKKELAERRRQALTQS